MHTYWVNEGTKGRRISSINLSTTIRQSDVLEQLSDRALNALEEASGDFVDMSSSLQEHAPGNKPEMPEPTPFGAAGEEMQEPTPIGAAGEDI